MNAIEIERYIQQAEEQLAVAFKQAETTALHCQKKVLDAFRTERISSRHFAPTEGYGYDDIGRDGLDKVFAQALGGEDALVRPQFANGTHAIFTALSGLLEPGDEILSATGKPYDTLEGAVGLHGNLPNALHRMHISFYSVPLKETGESPFDINAVLSHLRTHPHTRVVYVQRSRGYAWRESISVDKMEKLFSEVKTEYPNLWIVVDNCYGAFTEEREPTDVGADIIVGSLIKNCGGGIAPTGGYIVGRADLIERISFRLTVPGSGREVGSYAAGYRLFYQGLFMAPHAVLQSLKTAMLFGEVFHRLGYDVMPHGNNVRADVVQSIRFKNAEELIAFCRAIQAVSPVESFVVPEPWDMPGYEDQVIMAAGNFVQGSTSELSADGPIRSPFAVYVQGSLSYEHGKIALFEALKCLTENA